jgi:hypothetical protein
MQMLVHAPPRPFAYVLLFMPFKSTFKISVIRPVFLRNIRTILFWCYFGVLNYPTSGEFPVFGIMFQKLCHKNVLTKNNEEKAYFPFPSVALYKIIYLC